MSLPSESKLRMILTPTRIVFRRTALILACLILNIILFAADDSRADDHGDTCATATVVALNSTVNAGIDHSGDMDLYRIVVPDPGGTLTIYSEYTGDDTDTEGYLLDDGCNQIDFNDDGGFKKNFLIIRTVNPGTYYINVKHFDPDTTGTYILQIEYEADDHGSDCPNATPVACGSATAGRVYPAGNVDYFQLELATPGLVSLSTSGNMDSYGYLLDKNCSEISHDNDSGEAKNFMIEQMVDAGTYYIKVHNYSSSKTGDYSLDVYCTLAHSLTASADYGGSISPAGTIIVSEGGSQTFMINPASGNTISDVLVDGVSVGAVTTYTFTNVAGSHTISATFNVPSGACTDLSDIPLDVRRHGAPANIMFVIDDSGSMDWEYMTTDDDGKFQVGNIDYEYLFDLDDKIFKTGTHSDVVSGEDRMVWKGQWAGFNMVYYDPTFDYEPWPTLSDADPDLPRSFPLEAEPTLDMGATFHLFDGAIADYIVDNQSSGFSFSAPEVVVDDQDVNFSKNAVSGSWIDTAHGDAYAGLFYETTASGEYLATWVPDIPVAGVYEVYTRWIASDTRSTSVPYAIVHAGGTDTVYVDQRSNGGQWVLLGNYQFNQGMAGGIALQANVTDNTSESLSADAVKFVLIDGWDWATSSEAEKEHYYWTAKDGDYSAVWTPNMAAGEYNVYARWVDSPTRSQMVAYTINHAAGATTVTVDQQQDDGGWYLLGTYDFNAGSGNVTLAHTRTAWDDTACADAIKFVTTSASVVDIKNAHYYVWSPSEGRPYLVVVDGGTIRYWQVNDHDGDDTIEQGELLETTAPPADVQTGRNYVNERQNFANWFQYYRKRQLLTRYAIAKVITQIQGVQIGFRGVNEILVQPVLPVKVGGEDYTATLFSGLYSFQLDPHRGSTPLRQGLEEVGFYFDQDDGDDGGVGPSPLATEEEGGACQQNFAIMFTDSHYNGLPPSVGNADGDNGLPFADSGINTLADVAMYFYENDLADQVENRVPVNPADDAIHQHMVTYGVTFGVFGTMNPDDYDIQNCDAATCPQWPVPITATNDKRFKIDDVWHASVNGRGTFVPTANPEELVAAFRAVMQNIESRIGSAASVSVNGDELYGMLGQDVRMYQSSYSSDGWIGDVKAYAVDAASGDVITTSYVFSAAAMLESINWNDRIIATFDGVSTGLPFRFDSLADDQKTLLKDASEPDYTLAAQRVHYLRGDVDLEQNHGGAFRNRYQKLGDIVHSSPVFKNGVLYAGGNDGMLHAFSAEDGRELFAYVPRLVFHHLKELTEPNYMHKFFVDQTPAVRSGVEIATGTEITLLVGGLGKGGKGYYALDITDPSTIVDEAALAASVMWEYPLTMGEVDITGATNTTPIVVTATDHRLTTGSSIVVDNVSGNTAANGTWTVTVIDQDIFSLDGSSGNGAYTTGGTATYNDAAATDMGYSYSLPVIVRTGDNDRWVVLFGNGYNSLNGNAVLFVLDPADGTVLKTIDVGAGPCNGLSSPTAVDIDGDFRVDAVYAGDLKGNLWKFNTSGAIADWEVAFNDSGTPMPLFQAKDGANPQPITTKPDVMFQCDQDGLMVTFGTGKYLGEFDFSDNGIQTIYGIWDYSDSSDPSEYLGSFDRGAVPQLSNQPTNVYLLQQTVIPGNYFAPNGQQLRILTDNAMNTEVTTLALDGFSCPEDGGEGETACDPNGFGSKPDPVHHAGWYFDLPMTGERVPGNPMIREQKVVAIGFAPEQTPCGSGGNSVVMEMNACNGGRMNEAQFDINGDGRVDSNDMVALTDADGNPILDGNGNPVMVAPTGMLHPGRLLPPAVLGSGEEEIKYFSTNVGNIVTMRERAVRLGITYWMEIIQ